MTKKRAKGGAQKAAERKRDREQTDVGPGSSWSPGPTGHVRRTFVESRNERIEELKAEVAALLGRRQTLHWWQRARRAQIDLEIELTRHQLSLIEDSLRRMTPDLTEYAPSTRLAASEPEPRHVTGVGPEHTDPRWFTSEQ